jgi:hypothetical protein
VLSIEPPDFPGAYPRVLLDLVLHLPLAIHFAVLPFASVDLAICETADTIPMFLAVNKIACVDSSVAIID